MRYYILLTAGALLWVACGSKQKAVTDAAATSDSLMRTHVRVALVSSNNTQETFSATGMVVSDNESKPGFKTGGIIRQMFVKEGDFVKAGQLIATLDMTEIEAQVQQAQEGLAKAQRDRDRAKNLLADSVATLELFQNATSAVEVATRTVQIAEFNKRFSEVRAPMSGKVLKVLQRAGEVVGPGMPVCFILGAGKADWRIKVGLADRDWSRVRLGESSEVKFDAYPGQRFAAKITDLAAAANPGSGTFDAELTLTNAPPRLAAGLVAVATFAPAQKQAAGFLPVEAIVETDGREAFVFVVEQGRARKQPVVISRFLGRQAELATPLPAGAEVVVAGAGFLTDGESVVVVRD
jgi:RND family efflux transporter MFP subunit